MVYGVPQFLKMFAYYPKSSATVVAHQLFYVFKKKRLWLFCSQNPFYIKEQRTPRIFKSLFVADNAKRLAGEARE